MSKDFFVYPEGATPLTNDELYDLIPKHVTSQDDLNAVEQMNVSKGIIWSKKQKSSPQEILDILFVKNLHKKMFGDVWKWAGTFRKTDKNIGVFWDQVPTSLKNLLDDTLFHIENSVYSLDETAIRFHHRLVLVHPFPNGNGRHARIITDHLLRALLEKPFTWGSNGIQNYSEQTKIRKNYISSMRLADKGDIYPRHI